MHILHPVVYLLGSLLISAREVLAQNEFDSNFPSTFSFNSTTQFSWDSSPGTDVTGLFVVGDTDSSETYSLPCKPSYIQSRDTSITNSVISGSLNMYKSHCSGRNSELHTMGEQRHGYIWRTLFQPACAWKHISSRSYMDIRGFVLRGDFQFS